MTVRVDRDGAVVVITIDRPERRNAVDRTTATELSTAFHAFDADQSVSVAVLTGAGGNFCAGFDLKALAAGTGPSVGAGDGPMGVSYLRLSKPVVAAIEGYAVAGGVELALWCDLRVAAENAVLGVFNRRFGVPLVDMGTIRLPRLIGHSRALDLLLTGRAVDAREALAMGLVNRVVPAGQSVAASLTLAQQLSAFPQRAMRNDRLSLLEQWDLPERDAIANEARRGLETIASGETAQGISRFDQGAGRGGVFD